jgi:predicted permease
MSRVPAWRRYLTFWRAPIAQDVDDELRFHTNMRIAELVARGLSEEDARRAVAERLGDLDAAAAECVRLSEARERRARGAALFDALRDDLRYALRGLRARPGFAAAVIVTLALGIGANAAVFSLVDRLLFRSAPLLREPSRTHRLFVSYPNLNDDGSFVVDAVPYVRLRDLAASSPSLQRLAGYAVSRVVVGEPSEERDVAIAGVTPTFFDFFDAPPALGRYFDQRDDAPPSGMPVVVLSYASWQRDYGGRDDVLGATLRLGGATYTVIGVAPRRFAGLWPDAPPAALIPLSSYAAAFDNRGRGGLTWWTSYDFGASVNVLLTRKQGVSIAQMSAELTRGVRARWGDGIAKGPADPTAVVASTLSARGPEQSSESRVAALVGAMALVVLLIAGANVASLLLARALRRRREVAVRLALGISRRRLVAQLFTESILLASLGGAAGLLIARWAGPALRSMFLMPGADTPVMTDARTLAFVGVAVVLLGILSGLAPVWQARSLDVTRFLRIGAREGTLQRSRARAGLLVVQAALSVLLLVAAGLFVRSLGRVRNVDLGFDADSVLVVQATIRGVKLDSARGIELWNRLAERARGAPNVEHAALAQGLPFTCCSSTANVVRPPDMDAARFSKLPEIQQNSVTPDYFATLRTRIVRGRGIDSTDDATAPGVVVVSDRLARTLWPRTDAIGQCLTMRTFKPANRPPGMKGPRWLDIDRCFTVVGIAADITQLSLTDDPKLSVYFAYAQQLSGRIGDGAATARRALLAIRTRDQDAHSAESLRALLQSEMPDGSYVTVTPFADVVRAQMRSWQLGATIFVAFGVLAMLLAAVGLYSVIAYNVTQRAHEMGVRRALGAQTVDVLRLVVTQGMVLGGTGVAVGAALAFATAERIAPLLFDVSPRDPLVFGSVIAMMLGVTFAASLIPARRAMFVDPTTALRSE